MRMKDKGQVYFKIFCLYLFNIIFVSFLPLLCHLSCYFHYYGFQTDVVRLQSALSRLEEVDEVVEKLECKLSNLETELAVAEKEVHQKMTLITAAKERLDTSFIFLQCYSRK